MAKAYGFKVDGKIVFIKADTVSQAIKKFKKRFGYMPTEKNGVK